MGAYPERHILLAEGQNPIAAAERVARDVPGVVEVTVMANYPKLGSYGLSVAFEDIETSNRQRNSAATAANLN